MQTEIREAGERLKFLMEYATLPEEDLKLNSQTFNWPGRMDPIFEVSQQRLASRREKAENQVKERQAANPSYWCWIVYDMDSLFPQAREV